MKHLAAQFMLVAAPAILCGMLGGCGNGHKVIPESEFQESKLEAFLILGTSTEKVRERYGNPHRRVDNELVDGTVMWEFENDLGLSRGLAGSIEGEFLSGFRIVFKGDSIVRWLPNHIQFSPGATDRNKNKDEQGGAQ